MKEWRIYLAVPPEARGNILTGLSMVYPHERVNTVEWSGPEEVEGRFELMLDVAGDSESAALAEAARVYNEAREAVSLPPAEPTFLGYSIPAEIGEPPDVTYWLRADEAIGLGRYADAVIFVQIASEVLARRALDLLCDISGVPWVRDLYKGQQVHLKGGTTQHVFNHLSGREIQKEAWWEDYCVHLQRRHGVVHAGNSVDKAGAEASREACRSFKASLEETLKSGAEESTGPAS